MSFDLRIKNGDIVIGLDGDLDKVEGSEKLSQDLLKIAITPLGANPSFPWYGSPISKTLIGNAFDSNFTSSAASDQLKSAIETLMNLQKIQAQSSQIVTPEEQISAVEGVRVERNNVDLRFFKVLISVLSKAFTRVQTNFQILP